MAELKTAAGPTPAGADESGSQQLAEILAGTNLVHQHLVDRAQALSHAQKRWLGHVLLELGAIAPEDLSQAMSRALGLRVVDMRQQLFNADAMRRLPEATARRFDVLPLVATEGKLSVAMVNPLDKVACEVVRSQTGLQLDRQIATPRDLRTAVEQYYTRLSRLEGESKPVASRPTPDHVSDLLEADILHVDDLLRAMTEKRGSDLHISANSAPVVRVDGELVPIADVKLTPKQVNDLVYAILTDEQITHFEEDWELDFAYNIRGLSRFRVNVHKQRGTIGAVFRAVPMDPPSLDGLGLPSVLKTLAAKPRGLVLVTGPTGSGKSTTLAAMIREINVSRRCHIVTVEDPIEFLHRNERCMIIQREVGADTRSFAAALRHVLRQDPDVILIGEMRDLETISAAVTAAETGHLVLATLHTTSAAQTIDRIVDVFPPFQQEQIRVQLSTVLEGIICQTLLPLSDGKGRVCAQEILVATSAIRNLVREGKTHQMASVLQSSASEGMMTLDQALKELVLSAKVTPQVAMSVAQNPQEFQMFLRMR